jgi:hypothetical protein
MVVTDKEKIERYEKILKHLLAERTGYYFICGEGGEKDENGLPEVISICPTYGADWVVTYERKRDD